MIFSIMISTTIVRGQVRGRVVSKETNRPLEGVTLRLSKGPTLHSNAKGEFFLGRITRVDTITAYHLGYATAYVPISPGMPEDLLIALEPAQRQLEEVQVEFNTGYYDMPKERATGSFVHVDRELLNRSVSSNIMERFEGVVSGLHFDKRNVAERSTAAAPALVRGLSTINANASPLIVVDNFPYDADISNINPNDVESVTFLKDAAAASIWGARAGNGVIVIQTKRGRLNQPARVSVHGNFSYAPKPDLFYSPEFIPSRDFIDLEMQLFDQEFYNPSNRRPLSPVIEALLAGDASGEELMAMYGDSDIRRDAERFLYRSRTSHRYGVDISGGGANHTYKASAGFDRNLSNVVGDASERLTLSTANTYRLWNRLQLLFGVDYMQNRNTRDGLSLTDLRPNGLYPYAQLADAAGTPLAIPQTYRMAYVEQAQSQGLLDWLYRPLDELRLSDNKAKQTETRINTGLNYRLPAGFEADAKFQYQRIQGEGRQLYDEAGYYVRDLVNRFTQPDGSTPFPAGAILWASNNMMRSYSGRAQVNYAKEFGETHQLAALAGLEVRRVVTDAHTLRLYGYDDENLTSTLQIDYVTRFPTRPDGSAFIPVPAANLQALDDRYVSYFANASYGYKGRYLLSASARKDASNLFGVKTNQRAVPLWSVGGAWNIAKEAFVGSGWINDLKLRLTYGYAGNIDRSTTAFPIGRYASEPYIGLPAVTIQSPGNPQLRWEKVRTINAGLDLSLFANRLSGSVEYYQKYATDLLGDMPLDPTSGYYRGTAYRYRVNYADLTTSGVDIMLSSKNLRGALQWNTDLLFNYVKDRVSRYDFDNASATAYISTYINAIPREGYPAFGLYSYPWFGLDPATGDPQVLVDGELSQNYGAFVNGLTVDDLVYHGSQIPVYTGALRNTFAYKGLSLSVNLTWKAGYFFRAASVNYNNLFANWEMHEDYLARWQQPGDEAHTQVPSRPQGTVSNRDVTYLRSEILVEKGDHIRLQDVQLRYALAKGDRYPGLPFGSASVYLYARNLGILWRANTKGLDPDQPYTRVLPPLDVSLGFQFTF